VNDREILIISGDEVRRALRGQEIELIETVRSAYIAHRRGDSALPHSTFLRFPGSEHNRVIALPAFLGDDFRVAGIKWVSSFPDNIDAGLDRASAVVILNSISTGRPETILEGSQISAKRTAASAALAAQILARNRSLYEIGLIGCGLINFEVARFMLAAFPGLNHLIAFDLDTTRAERFAERVRSDLREMKVTTTRSREAVLETAPVVSIATTAIRPHIRDLSMCVTGATILHVSLRDIAPEVIVTCNNIVDDIDHVCRAQTSVHLAEQLVGHRGFINCTLAEIILGEADQERLSTGITIFSPFGLGILDLALSVRLRDLARSHGLGTFIGNFLPASWRGGEERDGLRPAPGVQS
jgi:ornithine cyclodeaminase